MTVEAMVFLLDVSVVFELNVLFYVFVVDIFKYDQFC